MCPLQGLEEHSSTGVKPGPKRAEAARGFGVLRSPPLLCFSLNVPGWHK
jgi:hypothetical protein